MNLFIIGIAIIVIAYAIVKAIRVMKNEDTYIGEL